MRTVFQINGARSSGVGAAHPTAATTSSSLLLTAAPTQAIASRHADNDTEEKILTQQTQSHSTLQSPLHATRVHTPMRSCHKKLGFDESTRPSRPTGLHTAATPAAKQLQALTASTPLHHESAHHVLDEQVLSPTNGGGPSAGFAHAAFLFPGSNGGATTADLAGLAITHTHTDHHHHHHRHESSSSPPRPFRHGADGDGSSPSPFLPAGSPSPSLSSMALSLSQSPAAAGAATTHSQSQSPLLFTPPTLFSPDVGGSHGLIASPASEKSSHRQSQSQSQPPQAPAPVPHFTTTIATDSRLSQPMPLKEKRHAASAVASAAASAAAAAASATSGSPVVGQTTPTTQRHSSRISAAEAKAAALAASLASTPVNSPPPASSGSGSGSGGGTASSTAASGCKGCNCKKSRCLKLYCECFARQGFCSSECKCSLCLNTPGDAHAEERAKAIAATLDRDPRAFFRSTEMVDAAGGKDAAGAAPKSHPKGCHCKKSACLKKYCECYQAGVQCTDACKCTDCKNGRPHTHDDTHQSPTPAPKSAKKKATASGSSTSSAVSASKRKRPPPAALSRAEAATQEEEREKVTPAQKRQATNTITTTLVAPAPAPSLAASRSSQRERSNLLRARENHVADENAPTHAPTYARPPRRHVGASSPLDPAALSPATATSSAASSTISSAPHQIGTTVGVRTLALQPRHTLVLGGVGSMSFQAQLAAHEAQLAIEKGIHPGSHAADELETDSDFTSCADSLHEVPPGTVLHTPVKQPRLVPQTSRPASQINTSFSALETLVEVASPSPRAALHHYRHAHAGLMSPVSPMSSSLSMMPTLQTPNSKPRHRALTFNGGSSASPLPPLFSPLRHSQAASPQMQVGSPFPQSISPAPMHHAHHAHSVLHQQHQSMALHHHHHHHSQPHAHAHASLAHGHSGTHPSSFRLPSHGGSISPFVGLHTGGSVTSHLTGGGSIGDARTQRDHFVYTPPLPITVSSALQHTPTDEKQPPPLTHMHTLIVS